jgi:hypothetical protein
LAKIGELVVCTNCGKLLKAAKIKAFSQFRLNYLTFLLGAAKCLFFKNSFFFSNRMHGRNFLKFYVDYPKILWISIVKQRMKRELLDGRFFHL